MNHVAEINGVPALPGVRYAVGESATRPWGTWEVLATGEGYTLKRIVVNTGQRLSLQYHCFRAEHWTVVQGVAEAEVNGRLSALIAGESVYVPLGAHHRLRNISDMPLGMTAAQTGGGGGASDGG